MRNHESVPTGNKTRHFESLKNLIQSPAVETSGNSECLTLAAIAHADITFSTSSHFPLPPTRKFSPLESSMNDISIDDERRPSHLQKSRLASSTIGGRLLERTIPAPSQTFNSDLQSGILLDPKHRSNQGVTASIPGTIPNQRSREMSRLDSSPEQVRQLMQSTAGPHTGRVVELTLHRQLQLPFHHPGSAPRPQTRFLSFFLFTDFTVPLAFFLFTDFTVSADST